MGVDDALRQLPSVDRLLQEAAIQALVAQYSRPLVLTAIRATLDAERAAVRAGAAPRDLPALLAAVRAQVAVLASPRLRRVINATGVILHTNLGRAPLSAAALAAMASVGGGYCNLEYDLAAGERGSRHEHVVDRLCRLTGATGALVVNNNASAVLLALAALAAGREVIVSRGQLVEIGGGFRVPDVLRQSGARLVEVGTTNRTYIEDYERAITPDTALLLRVHPSNFQMRGFVHSASAAELVALGRRHGIPVVDDLGSGSLLDTAAYGLAHEPMVQESVAAGMSLVCFSGDKLLGGPQAGIIVGEAALVAQLRRHPLTRAVRPDKLTIAALAATLDHYLRGEAPQAVPVWRMIATPLEALAERAERLAAALRSLGVAAAVVDGESTVGGGSLPGETLPSRLVAVRVANETALAERLRRGEPPVIGRLEREQLLLDLRTVLPEEDSLLLEALRAALSVAPAVAAPSPDAAAHA
ncbi:MAG TPA: L-seryl-tRNA(Sec) selenium transferase [Chloroflexota bacterium]|nr:L-seryl-tRNA(Sec) selenium transferase [Chloroflexota bacterium]